MRTPAILLGFLLCCGGDTEAVEEPDAQEAICTHSGFTPSIELVERDDELGVLFYTGERGTAPNIERLSIDFYFPLGAQDQAHEHVFTGVNLKDCHTCVTARRECSQPNCSNGKAFLAQTGTLKVDAIDPVGGSFRGSLLDLVLAEVEISVVDVESTLVPNGETLCLESYDFERGVSGV